MPTEPELPEAAPERPAPRPPRVAVNSDQHAEMVAEFATTENPEFRHLLAVSYSRAGYSPYDVLAALNGPVPAAGTLPAAALFGLSPDARTRLIGGLTTPPEPAPEPPTAPRERLALARMLRRG